jgi:uncharacterized membrane protein YkvA (DUF1232 family)
MNTFRLLHFFKEFGLTINMLFDYFKGDYKEVPIDTLSAFVIMIAYVISPVDLIPDIIPIVGWIDDFVVIRFILIYAKKDLKKYFLWKSKNNVTF